MKKFSFDLFKRRCRKCKAILIEEEPKEEWSEDFGGPYLVKNSVCPICGHKETTARRIPQLHILTFLPLDLALYFLKMGEGDERRRT